MAKLERMDMAGEIDLKMVVTEGGQNIRGHCEAVNQQVEDIFVVTEEMQKEIKEPLVDVLMEKELALTPMQRLGIVVGGQMVQFATASLQLGISNKKAMAQFKEFRAEQGNQRPTASTPPPPPQNPPSQPTQQQQPKPPVVEEEEYEAPEINISSYMNDEVKTEEEEFNNEGVTVEYEEPQFEEVA
jgi:hypothetical protein